MVGTVVGWLPPEDGDPALWHILHLDGDEEDLDEEELMQYLLPITQTSIEVSTEPVKTVAVVSKIPKKTPVPSRDDEEAEFDDNIEMEAETEIETETDNNSSVEGSHIINNYINTAPGRYQIVRSSHIGVEGLRQAITTAENIILNSLKRKLTSESGLNLTAVGEVNVREIRKQWETALRQASCPADFRSVLMELESFLHGLQAAEDRREEDEIQAAKQESRQRLLQEGWLLDEESAGNDETVRASCEYIGRSVRRFFNGFGRSDGQIIAFLPADRNEGLPLWRLEHFDGDEEDLDEADLLKGIRHFSLDLKEDDEVVVVDDDNLDGNAAVDEVVDDEAVAYDADEMLAAADGLTLWPTRGVRSRWIQAVQNSQTISELALALSAFVEHARNFGVLSEEGVTDTHASSSPSKSHWSKRRLPQQSSSSASSSASASTGMSPRRKRTRSMFEDIRRPVREATKKIKSYAEL